MGVLCKLCLMALVLARVGCRLTGQPRYYTAACNVTKEPLSCLHQIVNTEHGGGGSCWIRKVSGREKEKVCSLAETTELFPADHQPFRLVMYHQKNIFGAPLGAFFITFPELSVKSIIFFFQDYMRINNGNLCRVVDVQNISLPLQDDIRWDCPFFPIDIIGHTLSLTVLDERGRGGLYTFLVPNGTHVDPYETKLEDWIVFQYLHWKHVQQRLEVPVTIQLAPFANVSYNVSLMRCQDDCSNLALTDNKTFDGPTSVDFLEEDSPQRTEIFPLPHPGTYIITTQIFSPGCPAQGGCRLSRSPQFDVKQNIVLVNTLVTVTGVLLIIVTMYLACYYLQHMRKAFYHNLQETNRRTLLLIYLAETEERFNLVVKLATFLKETCFLSTLLVDLHSTRQNPNHWTSEHIQSVDRVVFVIPGNICGQSIKPIKSHWEYSLSYASGLHFSKYINKAANVILPFSAPVPSQIGHLPRFRLFHDLITLVNWLHNGTFFDRWFFWQPLIQSAINNKLSPLNDLKRALEGAAVYRESENDEKQHITHPDVFSIQEGTEENTEAQQTEQERCGTPQQPTKLQQTISLEQIEQEHSDTRYSSLSERESLHEPGKEFASSIPDVYNLNYHSSSSASSEYEGSILGDDEFLY